MSSTTHTPHTPRQRKQTMYEQYLRTDELLSLQKPDDERLHPDELTFQVVHQTFELWWKMTAQQLRRSIEQLRGGGYGEAARAIRRAVSAQGVVMQAMRQLEFVAPADFLVIRAGLGDGSGADSPGFRAILRAAPDLWDAFEGALAREHITLVDLYATPQTHPALYDCAEQLTDFDETFHVFRAAHLKLAQRNLGLQATGTGGTPMEVLARTLSDLLFPALWEARDALLARVQAQQGVSGASGHGNS
ncbi:MAG TPA: tryptophan 2,3-dioxygenase family protein [Ktedonobacterales bacterium]|nr:tryptophan 2,3-dioxygenase family protein [Ktedonobacterales bacterium]